MKSLIFLIQIFCLLIFIGVENAAFFVTFDPGGQVPEPSTSILMILGLLAGAGILRRNKRK